MSESVSCLSVFVSLFAGHSLINRFTDHALPLRTSRLPVIYVFGKTNIDSTHCLDELDRLLDHNRDAKCILMYDVACHHAMGKCQSSFLCFTRC